MSLFTQWVPADWSEEPHTEELEAYADRHDRLLRRGRAELQGVDPAPRHRRAVRDGARVRPDRRQHLPRRAVAGAAVPHAPGARLRRLPHADRRACTTAARPPTPAAASAASPAGRRPGPRSPTRRPASGRASCASVRPPDRDRSRLADAGRRRWRRCSRRAPSRSSAPARGRARFGAADGRRGDPEPGRPRGPPGQPALRPRSTGAAACPSLADLPRAGRPGAARRAATPRWRPQLALAAARAATGRR